MNLVLCSQTSIMFKKSMDT